MLYQISPILPLVCHFFGKKRVRNSFVDLNEAIVGEFLDEISSSCLFSSSQLFSDPALQLYTTLFWTSEISNVFVTLEALFLFGTWCY